MVLGVLVVLPLFWLAYYSVLGTKGESDARQFRGARLRPDAAAAVSHRLRHGAQRRPPVMRHRHAARLARGPHRPRRAPAGARLRDGLVRDAAVPRRHRLGDPGGAEQRHLQPDLPQPLRPRAIRLPRRHLHLHGAGLRHRLLHLSVRLHPRRQRARPRPDRPRGSLGHARRRHADHAPQGHHPARPAGHAGRHAHRHPAIADHVRLAGHPRPAGRLPRHHHQDLEPVPISAEARPRRRRRAAAADHHRSSAVGPEPASSAGAATPCSAARAAIRASSASADGAGSPGPMSASCSA